MSAYVLGVASHQLLSSLVISGGNAYLNLQRPASELNAGVHIERAGERLEVVVTLGGTSNNVALQAGDSANAQHLADYIESIANGTLDTAASARAPAYVEHALLPCWKCKGAAIGFDYCAEGPGTSFLHGAKCRHKDCQTIMGCESEAAAADVWNTIQREALIANHSGDATDMVNHPPHYTAHPSGIECIQVAEHLPFCLGNAFKYLFRRNAKNKASENIEKAIWYVNRHAERVVDWDGRLPNDLRWELGLIATHEPHPIGAAMLIIAGEPQCGGYEACVELLQRELERVRRVEAHG